MKKYLNFGLVFMIIALGYFTKPSNASNTDSLQTLLENQQGKERLATLMQLGNAYQKTDRNQSIDFFKDAYSISPVNDLGQAANISYKLAYNYSVLKQSDSAIKYYDIALLNYKVTFDTLNIMKTLTMKGILLQRLGKFGVSATHFSKGIDLFEPYWEYHQGDADISKKHLATMMSNYGISLYELGQFDSSLFYATENYKIKVEMGASSKQIAKALVNIGIVYLGAHRNKESIRYFTEANELFTSLQDSFNVRKCYNNIGMGYKQLGDTTKAISNYNKALEISRAGKFKSGIAISLINLSSLYHGRGEIKKAETILLESLEIGKELGNKQYTSTSYQNLSGIYLESGEYNKALDYAQNARRIIMETDELDLLEENNLLLSNIHEKLDNSTLSLKYLREYNIIHDSLFNADNTERFNRLQTEFETSKKEQEIQILKIDKKNQLLENQILKSRQTVFISIIVMILILVVIIGFMIFLKHKKDQQINLQKVIVHRKETELAQSELEKIRLKEEELQQSILYKSKQLSTHALHMMQKNTMLHEMQLDIKAMSIKASDEDKPNYKRINLQINQSLRSQKDWDVFKLYFEDVNKNFYQKLNEINPELTTNDHRLCALIKLNMTSKEMASVLNVAPNSIKSSRYRLKKKLGLDVDADLEEFIRGLG